MNQLIIRHQVANFDEWKVIYEEVQPLREKVDMREVKLWRNDSDPNDVFILFDIKDKATAKDLVNSPEIQDAMQRAGVISKPEITFLTQS